MTTATAPRAGIAAPIAPIPPTDPLISPPRLANDAPNPPPLKIPLIPLAIPPIPPRRPVPPPKPPPAPKLPIIPPRGPPKELPPTPATLPAAAEAANPEPPMPSDSIILLRAAVAIICEIIDLKEPTIDFAKLLKSFRPSAMKSPKALDTLSMALTIGASSSLRSFSAALSASFRASSSSLVSSVILPIAMRYSFV